MSSPLKIENDSLPGAAAPDVHGNFEYASQVLGRKRIPRRVVGDDVAIVDDDNAIRKTCRKIEIVENGQPLRPSRVGRLRGKDEPAALLADQLRLFESTREGVKQNVDRCKVQLHL